jgi:2-epi-5-epi-valiolone synthase
MSSQPERRKAVDVLRRGGSRPPASSAETSQASPAQVDPPEALLDTTALSTDWVVATRQSINYDVRSREGLFDVEHGDLLAVGASGRATRLRRRPAKLRRFVVVDEGVDAIYGERIREYFDAHDVATQILALDVSESKKTMSSVFAVVDAIDAFGISRRHEPIIAVGGGVLLDIVGLAASLYRRSTPYIRVPTTLMGIVDAGIGAKTGVNYSSHKNRLGSYFPPEAVFLDRTFLTTLEPRELCNGLAEILKIALVKDRRLFELLEEHGEQLIEERLQVSQAAEEVLRRSIHGMLEELQPNLWEETLERLVDFGHTFSPALEMRALPSLLHGEAVTIDMALSTALSLGRGLVSVADADRILATMQALRLPTGHELCRTEFLWEALQEAVDHRDGLQRVPLPVGIGAVSFVNDLQSQEIAEAAALLDARAA